MNNQNLGMGIAAQTPEIFGQQTNMSNGEMGRSYEMQQTAEIPQAGERQISSGLENAVGVATVGATGMTGAMPGMPGAAQGVLQNAPQTSNGDVKLERVPEVAKDGEKMEKEWMKRAQDVVAETRNDPSKRLVQAALLREEYMRKRFNRILGEHE